MRKHKMFDLYGGLLFLLILGHVAAIDGTFEDTDKSKDVLIDNTQFDLRHTIPGEPEVDYPIYSKVPKTDFLCTGRHEGYYADVESRCQAFRICAHTARSVHGFGFLCPNGTLFSQKNFVCDWYRNVNCDESESYFSKNDKSRVGSNSDMMATVRQMMEYPMKTISQALTGNSGSPKNPIVYSHHTQKKQLDETSDEEAANGKSTVVEATNLSRKTAVTREQVESVNSYGEVSEQTALYDADTTPSAGAAAAEEVINDNETSFDLRFGLDEQQQQQQQQQQPPQFDASSAQSNDDVYVNSLGELSTDPGVNFDHTNANIIAESPRTYYYGKTMNFAEKINAGLNDLVELPSEDVLAPEYVKNLRTTANDQLRTTDLASNINGLIDEISYELEGNSQGPTAAPASSQTGYEIETPQKTKHAFKFLSRGFSSQSDRTRQAPYSYGKPKQTASTVRFSPNELPIDSPKDSFAHTHKTYESPSADDFEFTIMTTTTTNLPISSMTTTTEAPVPQTESYSLTTQTEDFYLSPLLSVPLETAYEGFIDTNETYQAEDIAPATTKPYIENISKLLLPPVTSTSEGESAASVETSTPNEFNAESSLTKFSMTQSVSTSSTAASASADEAKIKEELNAEINKDGELVVDEDKIDVNQQAANLLLSGVKLSTFDEHVAHNLLHPIQSVNKNNNNNHNGLYIQVADVAASSAAIPTTTEIPSTYPIVTTTPMSTSTEVVTEINSVQERIRSYRRFANQQRSSKKPLVYSKRTTTKSTTTTTTTKPLTTARSYLKRVAASRLRLSRLSNARGGINTLTSTTTKSATTTAAPAVSGLVSTTIPSIDKRHGNEASKKFSVRNIDNVGRSSDTNSIDPEASGTSRSIATWESVRNNLQRYQVQRKQESAGHDTTDSPASPATQAPSNTIHSQLRSRNRFTKFKTQSTRNGQNRASLNRQSTTTTVTTSAPVYTQSQQNTQHKTSTNSNSNSLIPSTSSNSPSTTASLSSILNSVSNSISSSSFSSSSSPSSPSAPAAETQTHSISVPSIGASVSASSNQLISQEANVGGSSSTASPAYISFDKLTRSIVDDSILQNFRSNPVSSRSSSNSYLAPVVTVTPRSVYGSQLAETAQPTVTVSSPAFSYGKVLPQDPSQLIPPQRPQHLPQIQTPPTIQRPTPATLTQSTPRIVIARAEGQRIEPNSVSSIISSLISQQQSNDPTPTPYVPLNDFLTKKFGNQHVSSALLGPSPKPLQSYFGVPTTAAPTYLQQHQQYQQQQQKQQHPQPQLQKQAPTTATFLQQHQQYQQQQQQQQQKPVPVVSSFLQQHQQYQQQLQQQKQQLNFITQQYQQQQEQPQTKQQQPQQQQPQPQQNYYQVPAPTKSVYKQQQQQTQYPQQQQQQQQPQQYRQQAEQYQPQQHQTQPHHTQNYHQQQQYHQQPHQQQHQHHQQQQHQHQIQHQPSSVSQQAFSPQNIFASFQQQQQQLPQFPPLATPSSQYTTNTLSSGIFANNGGHDNYLNVQLPTLPNGLIPAPTTQIAQKRSDTAVSETDSIQEDSIPVSAFTGVSSYEVPINSIGRLPNDITRLLRRLRKF